MPGQKFFGEGLQQEDGTLQRLGVAIVVRGFSNGLGASAE